MKPSILSELNSPFIALIALIIFLSLGYCSYQKQHEDFISEKLSQYDEKKTKPYIRRPNVLEDRGVIYQADLAEMFDTQPIVFMLKNGEKE